jgi:hypothetical protein
VYNFVNFPKIRLFTKKILKLFYQLPFKIKFNWIMNKIFTVLYSVKTSHGGNYKYHTSKLILLNIINLPENNKIYIRQNFTLHGIFHEVRYWIFKYSGILRCAILSTGLDVSNDRNSFVFSLSVCVCVCVCFFLSVKYYSYLLGAEKIIFYGPTKHIGI